MPPAQGVSYQLTMWPILKAMFQRVEITVPINAKSDLDAHCAGYTVDNPCQ